MNRIFLTKLLLAVTIIVLGNVFWILFANSLLEEHLLTNSLPHIALSFVYPIVVFGLYLSSVVFFSILEKSKVLIAIIILCSFLTYTSIVGIGWQTILGEIAISTAICFYLVSFHQSSVLIRNKSSLVARSSLALTGATIIVTLVIAINFYGFYRRSLASSNALLSNRAIVRGLSPLLRPYISDLHIKNLDESFGIYVAREARNAGQTVPQMRKIILEKLDIQTTDDTKPVRTALVSSLNQTILRTFGNYRKQLPIFISLGLAVITQTIMTVSSVVSYGFLQIFYFIFLRLKLIKAHRKEVVIKQIIINE